MSRSANHRASVAEPEVWFRIVQITEDGQDTRYQRQSVEVGLGPRSAFEHSSIGTLTRRVRSDRVVSAVLARRDKPERPKRSRKLRVVGLLQRAIEWEALLASGQAVSQAQIARKEGISRARVTQIMRMLRLAPKIQEHILSMPHTVHRPAVTERAPG